MQNAKAAGTAASADEIEDEEMSFRLPFGENFTQQQDMQCSMYDLVVSEEWSSVRYNELRAADYNGWKNRLTTTVDWPEEWFRISYNTILHFCKMYVELLNQTQVMITFWLN